MKVLKPFLFSILVLPLLQCSHESHSAAETDDAAVRRVRLTAQARPGGPVEEIEMGVHSVPVDPPTVPGSEANLDDDEIVLGVISDGKAVAFSIRFLAMSEVINSRVGDTLVAPTW